MVVDCKKCLKFFQTKKECIEHEKSCVYKAKNRLAIFNDVTIASYKCNLCNLKYGSTKTLNKHIKIVHTKNAHIGQVISSTTKNYNTNNTNIFLNTTGKESIEHITKDVVLSCSNVNVFSNELVKELYCNVKVRKNNNWCIMYPIIEMQN